MSSGGICLSPERGSALPNRDVKDNLRNLISRSPQRENNLVLEYVEQVEDYCSNFGDQWNRYREMQLDSASGSTESAQRLVRETGISLSELRGKTVLDVGCGAGRFSEIALRAGAKVVAVDLSRAIFAAAQTLSAFDKDKYLLLRASLYDLPLKPGSFDLVYCLGVLQHTPDPLGGLQTLAKFVAKGGRLAVWIYERRSPILHWTTPRYLLRPLFAACSERTKFRIAASLTTAFFPAGWFLSQFGKYGQRMTRFLPYAARHERRPGSLVEQWRYSVLDTYDWYGPMYDLPQRECDVVRTMQEAGLSRVRRLPAPGMAVVGERVLQPEFEDSQLSR